MQVALAKTRSGHIIPATDDDRLKLRAWKPGDVVIVKASRPRNLDHWRKFMALVAFVYERHPRLRTMPMSDDGKHPVLELLKILTGHVFTIINPSTGEAHISPKSVSFYDMDEGDFIAWSAKAKPHLLDLMEQFPERTKTRHGEEIDSWTHWCLH